MTEAEWLASTDPKPMLALLGSTASDRKLRLFAIACCRRIDRLITDSRGREALEFAERNVDVGVARRQGRAAVKRTGRRAQQKVYRKAFSFPFGPERSKCLSHSDALVAATQTLDTDPTLAARFASSFSSFAVAWEAQATSAIHPDTDLRDSFERAERTEQARLLRDLFGNPFRPVLVDPLWRTSSVADLARGIYADRAFDRLAILADALLDAGCNDETLLQHCQSQGQHLPGCWAIDLILAKE